MKTNYFAVSVVVVVLGVLMFSSQKAAAQYSYRSSTTTFGIQAGPNISYLSNDEVSGAQFLLGFEAGGYVEIPIADNKYIHLGLMYVGKGVKGEEDDGSGNTKTTTIRLNYLVVPIDYFGRKELANGSAFVGGIGPYVGYGISGKVSVDGMNGSVDPFKEMNGEILLKRLDVGFNFRLRYEMVSGVNVGINFNYGLISIAKQTNTRNLNLGLTVGYSFKGM